jgi:hypothetical protein
MADLCETDEKVSSKVMHDPENSGFIAGVAFEIARQTIEKNYYIIPRLF